ncbi:predicted protein [Naegleria gruberi]|uniref:Predicted protein n=1 Tax=Naegleria gruberi TaxID=5762 RepID=D2VCW1_NAEGR|nr:uncharacterized protein NAEGRDRAFT_48521 [Naegleria gruberi]EFC45374.1 predicted protein [Naegleria gruberi]|eukprot:XP_002678118.1 predicted protein [Naegleria gruberi strain NEG-M]
MSQSVGAGGELLLEWTRKLITSQSEKAFFYNIVQTRSGNDESLFNFPKCSISKGTEQFIERINSIIEKSQSLNHVLAKYIKQATVLYRVLIPKIYGELINQFPQFSMILFNDCHWIAKELDILCVKYKIDDGFKSLVCDGASTLRAFSEEHRKEFIDKQTIILITYLQDCNKFKDVYSNMKQNKKSFEKIVDHLDHLRRLWVQVIPQDNGIVMASLGAILEPIIATICSYILNRKDIGENESQDISSLMTYLVKWISENFSYENEDILKFIPSLYKFRAIKSMLVMSLLNVVENFKVGGTLYGLTSAELTKLIQAIFEDSKTRREVINQISQP